MSYCIFLPFPVLDEQNYQTHFVEGKMELLMQALVSQQGYPHLKSSELHQPVMIALLVVWKTCNNKEGPPLILEQDQDSHHGY